MKRVLFDLEGNGLLPEITKVHCIASVDVDTGAKCVWGPNEIAEALEYLREADVLIAHNGLRYDFPVLEKLHGFVVPFEKKLDTLILARLMFPDIRATDGETNAKVLARGGEGMGKDFGRHTLRAWGARLGVSKGDFEGPWDKWTPAMQAYCVQDIDTSLALWKHLDPDAYSQDAIKLEHRVSMVCDKITEAGWPFDLQKAGTLHATLAQKKHELEQKLAAEFSGWVDTKTFIPKRNNKTLGYVKDVPFDKKIPITFNPGSRQHIARALKERGWVPTEFTENGQPKLDDEIIENIAVELPAAADIGEYLMIDKRLGQLADGDKAWLKYVGDDLCIHGEYNPMGTVTSRAAHFRPNLGQVPNSGSPYGKECRELFTVLDGFDLVGADMEGLEIRCLCHSLLRCGDLLVKKAINETAVEYTAFIAAKAQEFTTTALDGDIHWANVQAMGLAGETEARDKHNALHTIVREHGAKRFFYAWLYGAGGEKAGRILLDVCRAALKANPEWGALLTLYFGANAAPAADKLRSVGNRLKSTFISKIPALGALIDNVKAVAEKHGVIPGLDKRRIPVRSTHAALNTLLQSAGAILCKRWLCDFYDAALAEGFTYGWDGDFVILGWIHDEIQIACRNGLGDELGRLLTSTAEHAGDSYGFRVRLNSKYKIGRSWADTH